MAEETASFANTLSGEIFVVDDDAAIRDLLAMLLSRRGYKVAGFADGPSLIAAMRTQSPACILLDVQIPGKSGLDILKELNARNHPAPVIIISGKGDIAMAVDAIKSGALDFIEKPFSGSDVVARVEEVDRRRSQAQGHGPRRREVAVLFSRPRAADGARAGSARPDRRGRHQQGGRTASRHQLPHHRNSPRPDHGKARRQERRRPDAHRAQREPRPKGSSAK